MAMSKSARPDGKVRKVFEDVSKLTGRQQGHIVRVVSALNEISTPIGSNWLRPKDEFPTKVSYLLVPGGVVCCHVTLPCGVAPMAHLQDTTVVIRSMPKSATWTTGSAELT